MKLILASAGFYTDEIVQKCVEFVGKPQNEINIAVINEAYAYEFGDHSWLLNDLDRIKNNFGGSMELVNLLALDMRIVLERISLADVIYVSGGHTDYLASVFGKIKFDEQLVALLNEKVYVGSSAGSMVLGRRVSTQKFQKIYGERDDFGSKDYLGLVDFAIRPHMDSPYSTKCNKEILLGASKDYKGIIYAISDDSAVIVDDEKMYTIGSKPLIIKDGQVIEYKSQLD